MYNEAMGKTHFWVFYLFNITFFRSILSAWPLPYEYNSAGCGAGMMSQSVPSFMVLRNYSFSANGCHHRCRQAVSEEKVWDGAEGLEWTVATPAPYHTFGLA